MNLHENKELFRQAVQTTAQQKGILDIYVEKDYWVTYALHTIFNSKVKDYAVFKGGTALSKCYGLIDRFSEDIDLVVLQDKEESNSQLTKKIKAISKAVADVLPEVDIKEVTRKMGMNRKTAHSYSKEFRGDYGQIRDVIIVEATWLGYYEPYDKMQVNSYIYDMMVTTNQGKLAEQYGLLPFNVLVLATTRTLCEKIMSLVRFSYTEDALEDLKKKIRHIYDIHKMLEDKSINGFFQSDDFSEMLLKVAQDDVVSYPNNNDWLQHHPNKCLLFLDVENKWKELKPTYNSSFKNMVYGILPNESEILNTLKEVVNRLKNIEWEIDVNNKET